MSDVVFRRDDATGLTIGTDGEWLLTVKDSERFTWNRIPAIISRVSPTLPVGSIVEDGRVELETGSHCWIGILPTDSLYYLANAFLPFVEAYGNISTPED